MLPIKLNKVGRTAIYGSWFNFYLCSFTGKVEFAGESTAIRYPLPGTKVADRCELG